MMPSRAQRPLAVFREYEEEEGGGGGPGPAEPGDSGREEAQAWLTRLHAAWETSPQNDDFFKLLRGSSGKAGDRTVSGSARQGSELCLR